MLIRGPVKCPSTPNQPAPMTTARDGAEDQRIAGFRLGEEADLPLRSRPSRSVHTGFFRPLNGAWHAPSNGTNGIACTDLENFAPQAPTSGKRTWPRRRQAAGGPPGLPRCCHRLRSPHLTPSSPEPAYFGPLRPLGVQTSPASLTKKWPHSRGKGLSCSPPPHRPQAPRKQQVAARGLV